MFRNLSFRIWHGSLRYDYDYRELTGNRTDADDAGRMLKAHGLATAGLGPLIEQEFDHDRWCVVCQRERMVHSRNEICSACRDQGHTWESTVPAAEWASYVALSPLPAKPKKPKPKPEPKPEYVALFPTLTKHKKSKAKRKAQPPPLVYERVVPENWPPAERPPGVRAILDDWARGSSPALVKVLWPLRLHDYRGLSHGTRALLKALAVILPKAPPRETSPLGASSAG